MKFTIEILLGSVYVLPAAKALLVLFCHSKRVELCHI